MAIVPEFISVLRDIRDTKYPNINTWYTSVNASQASVAAMQENVVAIQDDVTAKNTQIKTISVVNPVATVPNQPNGNAGSASVVYNGTTNQFTFRVPVGPQGQSMRIDYTVPTTADLLNLTVNKGDIVFVEFDSSQYVKLDTGANASVALDWSDPIAITPATEFIALSDTPAGYTSQAGKFPIVSDSETGLVFKTGAEVGIIGYNYVKNPLFNNLSPITPVLAETAFGSNERGYGSFLTHVGTPTLASDHVRVTNGVTITNTTSFTKGKSSINVSINIETLVPNSTIATTGNTRLFLNGSNQLAVTDGTTTNSLATMTVNTTDTYEIMANSEDLVVLNKTTGVVYSSSLSLTIVAQTSGLITLGGAGFVGKFFACSINDRSSYTRVDGVYETFAENWSKQSTGGDMIVFPDVIGADKGMRFLSSALATSSTVRFTIGDGGQFAGKEVTFSFEAFSSGVGANSISMSFVTDRGSQVTTSRLITQVLGTTVLDNAIEKKYSATFTIDAVADGTFFDADSRDYIEVELPSSAQYWINVKKPKIEVSALATEFTPQFQLETYSKTKIDSELALKADIGSATKVSARNSIMSASAGVHALLTTPTPSHKDIIYTGNGTSQNVVTGLPSVSRPWVASASYTIGDIKIDSNNYIYRALTTHTGVATVPSADATNWEVIPDGVSVDADNADIWIKNRSIVSDNVRFDTLRGNGKTLYTNLTSVEASSGTAHLSSFNVDGFTVGTDAKTNGNTNLLVAWCEYFDKMVSFTTNHGKRGIVAFNAQSGKFIISYVGSGVVGQQIPHGVGTRPNLVHIKDRDEVINWMSWVKDRPTEYFHLSLNTVTTESGESNSLRMHDTYLSLDETSFNYNNKLNIKYIAYGSSNRKNHSYIGSYVGKGVAGNPVDVGMDLLALSTAGKNVKVMIKALSAVNNWFILDSTRGVTKRLIADLSNAEGTDNAIAFTTTGFTLQSADTGTNQAGIQYLIEVTVEDFDNANGGIEINPSVEISYAEGSNTVTGDLDSIETTLTALALPLIAGAKNYFYIDKGLTVGSTIYPPIEAYPYVTFDANSDTYDVAEGVMRDTTGTPISRVYTGEAIVDISGEIIPETLVEYAVKRTQVTDLVVHGTLNVRNIPVIDPLNFGDIWNDNGTLKISLG